MTLSKNMQALDSVPDITSSSKITCCYVNATNSIQIVRITNIENWYFERVVFPGQRLLFEALTEAKIEIHTGAMASSILADIIPCIDLALREPGLPDAPPGWIPPQDSIKAPAALSC